MLMKAVVAVGNAFCAFSKELVDAFFASHSSGSFHSRRRAECGVDK